MPSHARQSAGLLMFRRDGARLEVLLAHPGGPFWEARHQGAWTIPKGGIHAHETMLEAAIREFREETGFEPCPPYLPLGPIRQRSGKIVHAWAFEGTCDPARLVSVTTTTEWPPRSGRYIEVPEIDRAEFYPIGTARTVINVAQIELLDRLERALRSEVGRRAAEEDP
jgi:predicted NUDIX family NTP pyrophosphohydrolase